MKKEKEREEVGEEEEWIAFICARISVNECAYSHARQEQAY